MNRDLTERDRAIIASLDDDTKARYRSRPSSAPPQHRAAANELHRRWLIAQDIKISEAVEQQKTMRLRVTGKAVPV